MCRLQHGTGNGHKLFLPFRNVDPILRENGIITVGQAGNHAVDVGCLCRRNHRLPGGIRTAIGDIVVNGSVKQPGILQYHGKRPPEAFPCHLINGLVIDTDFSSLWVIKTHEQIDNGSFSCTGRAYNGNHIPRLGLQVHIL